MRPPDCFLQRISFLFAFFERQSFSTLLEDGQKLLRCPGLPPLTLHMRSEVGMAFVPKLARLPRASGILRVAGKLLVNKTVVE